MYTENYKILLKEVKEDKSYWKDISCSHIRIFNDVKMLILLKMICRFNKIPTKIPGIFFGKKRKIKNSYGNSNIILKKKNKVGRPTFPDFKIYYTA